MRRERQKGIAARAIQKRDILTPVLLFLDLTYLYDHVLG